MGIFGLGVAALPVVSLRDRLLQLTPEQRIGLLVGLSDDEAAEVLSDWELWARSNQLPPCGDWDIWVILAGRGWGKNRTSAEYVKGFIRGNPGCRVALVARTFADGRDTIIEGESGLLSIFSPGELKGGDVESAWNRSLGELYLANGSRCKVYSSEKPMALRGPQHHLAICDEISSWKDANRLPSEKETTWSNLILGLRLGKHPRCVVTTTPKPVKLLRGHRGEPGILDLPGVVITRGSTFENLANLAPTFRKQILNQFKGTRLGRQELYGEILEDVEGALWNVAMLDRNRVTEAPNLSRIVTAIDPAVTSHDESDETGIIVAGVGMCSCLGKPERHAFILKDASGRYSPDTWARKAIYEHHVHEGDRIIAEVNQGGDLVENTLKTIEPGIPFKKVHATRGKLTRAEPIAALFEQGKVHMVGYFPELEDQLCTWTQGMPSPDRLDACVYAAHELLIEGTEWYFA